MTKAEQEKLQKIIGTATNLRMEFFGCTTDVSKPGDKWKTLKIDAVKFTITGRLKPDQGSQAVSGRGKLGKRRHASGGRHQ